MITPLPRPLAPAALAALLLAAAPPLRAADTQPATAPAHIVLGRSFSRCNDDGTPAPRRLAAQWAHESDGYILTNPAVQNNRVYAASCIPDITGETGAVFCYDALTGKKIWRRAADTKRNPLKPICSSPALTADGKHLLIGQGLHEDRNCALLCLASDTGAITWEFSAPLHIESSPALFTHPKYGDIAVVGCGAIEGPDNKPVGNPGFVLAVQVSTGKELFRHLLADPESSPAIAPDGTVYIGSGFNGSAIVALRSDSKADLADRPRQLWRTATPFPATTAVTLISDTLLIGCGNATYTSAPPRPQGAVLALNAATGKILWTFTTKNAVLGEIAARDNTAIVPCKSGELLALNLATGKLLWSTTVADASPLCAGVVFTGALVYAPAANGTLAIIDASPNPAARVLEKINLNDPARPGDLAYGFSSPTLYHGRLYIGSETGGLRCLVGK